ncbi:uncharacterized protein [Apostichopus japonicus]|uniref:uncharacterized protein n=1 Tax=Stichopus japonicus TaxID=307972 RepID=UPI003AB80FD1
MPCKNMDIGKVCRLLWFTQYLFFAITTGCNGKGTGECTTKGTCKCVYDDGSHIDLHEIAKKDYFAFDYMKPDELGSVFMYAYNPCYPVNDDECKGVAGCQKNADNTGRVSIGDANSAKFSGSDSSIAIEYTSTVSGTLRSLTVYLVCDKTATDPTLTVKELSTKKTYEYILTSICCCPNGCITVETDGLSFGSIICITFACIFVTYLVAGVLFMKYVRKAEGREVIPNYSLWAEVPGLVKDGGKYTYSKILHLLKRDSQGYKDIQG